jgi:hypothetical protein
MKPEKQQMVGRRSRKPSRRDRVSVLLMSVCFFLLLVISV